MLSPENKTREHLANERTFLAWIRTSIALMGFGFVVVKFAVFIRQAAVYMKEPVLPASRSYSAEIGLAMVFFGAVTALVAYLNFRKSRQLINSGNYSSSSVFTLVVTLMIIVVSALLIWYLLPNLR